MVVLNESAPACLPEELAERIVKFVAGPGSSHVELRAPGLAPVCVCGHRNPAVVRAHAEAIRRFLTAVIRTDRAARPDLPEENGLTE